jgi:hypothetical protein
MESSKRIFAAIVAAGIMGAGGLAIAQPGAGGCDGQGPGMMRGGMMGTKFDPAARADQRLSRLKTDLKITAEQEPLWQAFADKARSEAGQGFKAMREQAQDATLTAPERMSRMAEVMKQRIGAMESVNESFKRLYDGLTPEQKKAADQSMGRWGQMGHHGGPGMGRRG